MELEQLRGELAQMQASVKDWIERKAQAEQTVIGAQRQIDVHNGHIERIGMWLKRLESAVTEAAVPELPSTSSGTAEGPQP